MSDFELKTPVAFFIFNRPDTTARVFAEIRRAKPQQLIVIGDGARANREGEAEKVAAARAVISGIDWDCDVLTNFSETNMGCRNRMTSGLDFVFGEVERAILLEDDCLPHPTFFQFCEESLERYRDDERIGMISGDNFQFGTVRTAHSYYFSRYGHIWGWATWRRAWNHYDRNASGWPAFRDGGWLDAWTHSAGERDFWARCFDTVREGRVDAWDYQWLLTAMIQGTLAVIPEVNLVSNIGFGADATHTKVAGAYTNVATMPMLFPLSHPTIIQRHGKADAFAAKAYGA